ncbi:MAG TPA: VIT domain-containing protein [Actinomycetota bacterium]
MTASLPLLTDEEVARGTVPAGDEAGVGTLATDRGNLPLEAVEVAAAITGLVARTMLTQTFGNPFDQPLEATYIFPLPDRAAVSEFRMEVGERVVEGVLKERGEARATYDQAIREGRRASIAEEERPGVFTMRVGNLLPGETVRVRLVMTGPLPWDDGEATYRFPLVVAPRYIPGAPLEGEPVGAGTVPDTDAVPDASRITPPVLLPGFPNPIRLDIRAEIDPGGLELGEVRSSLHTVVEQERDGVRVVRVEPGERANRDFVLELRTGGEAVATSLATAPDREGTDGTFALTLLPPAGADPGRPRDLVFVLDRSGSMAGWKMVAARRAAARMVDSLRAADRFAVLAFDNRVETPPALGDKLEAATDRARFQAVEFLSRLDARGGTEMAAPLTQGLDRLAGAGEADAARDRVLVLVTDGQVGNEDQILRQLAPRLGDVRVYTVGIDSAVNEGFLKRLAGLGGGACELVESEDRLDAVLDRVRQRIGTPVVTGLELEAAGLEIDPGSVSPPRLPALLAGVPLVVCGRYRGRPEGALALSGLDAAGGAWRAVVPATSAGTPALRSVWARAHVRDLEDRYASAMAPEPELERRIVRTSLEFGVLSRFTAFVAVDTVVVNQDGRLHRVVQPVEIPAGWELTGLAGRPEQAAPRGMALAAPGAASRGVLRSLGAPRQLARLAPEWTARRSGPLGGPWTAPGSPLEQPAPPLSGRDLAAYRRRARDLAGVLEAAVEGDVAWRLGVVGRGVATLVADLDSVGADEREVEPLRRLAAELDRPFERLRLAPAVLLRLRDRAVAALTSFAGT